MRILNSPIVPKNVRRGPFPIFYYPLLQNIKKLKGDPLGIISEKSHNAEKTERGTLWIFQRPFRRQVSKKIEGGPFGEKIFEKSLTKWKN